MTDTNQKDLLSAWFSQNIEKTDAPTNSDAVFGPLSNGQQRIFFLQELNPDNPFYHYCEDYIFEGEVDIEKLTTAFKKVVSKHEVLRTLFFVQDGHPTQHIQKDLEPFISITDFTHQNLSETIHDIKVRFAQESFDLTSKSPVRLNVIIEKNKTHFLVTLHHMVSDMWSMRKFREDWAAFYKNPQLTAVPDSKNLRYLDYSIQESTKRVNQESLDFWIKKVEGSSGNLEMPFDFKRPKKKTYKGDIVSHKVAQSLFDKIEFISKEAGVTPFTFYLTVFNLLLYKYTASNEITVGTPISNRNSTELEQTIGFFTDTLILINQLKDDITFKELLRIIHTNSLEAFEHSEVAFENIVKELNLPREESINPIFQMMFVYHEVEKQPSFDADIKMSFQPLDLGVAKFDLTLFVTNEGTSTETTMIFSKDIYLKSKVESMMRHYHHILDQVVTQVQSPISNISLLDNEEIARIQKLNSGPIEKINSETVLTSINHHFNIRSNQECCWSNGITLSYGQLDDLSNRVAQNLLSKGLQIGDGVGLLLQPGHQLLVSIIGILRAGGYYIPLDPEYPAERIQYMMHNSNSQWIIYDQAHDVLQQNNIKKIKYSDVIIATQNTTVLPVIKGTDAVYMIYTSGSSGKPKGVLVRHEQLVNSTEARKTYYGEDKPRFLLMSSFSFDSSIAGIFWSVYSGGCLITTPKRIEQNLELLASTISESKATHTLMLPSLYNAVLRFIDSPSLQSLRYVIVAGEACTNDLIHQHTETLPHAKLYNEYGPTETTVWCTVDQLQPGKPLSIGRPILNTSTFIVDANNNLCPIGIPGELLIGGKNVTQGYYKNTELTNQKFVSFPHLSEGRLYRTGDLVKYNDEGNLMFLGRKDRQVKIRGYRIELESIQNVLLENENIKQCIVDIIDNNGQKKIVAYWSGAQGADIAAKEITQKKLPNYMQPDQWCHVDVFPTLPNGKINLKELHARLDFSRDENAETIVLPSSDKEHTLLEIWIETLGKNDISVEDNFFSIGGDSIKSIQVISLARKKGFNIKTEDIFTFQKLNELAAVMQPIQDIGSNYEEVIGQGPFLPIHNWFFETHQAAPQHWGQAFRLEFESAQDPKVIKDGFNQLLKHHDALRSTFDILEKSISIPSFSPKEVEILDTTPSYSDYLNNWMSISEVNKGNLFRCALSSDFKNVILSGHHLVLDAISWGILMEDFQSSLQGTALPSKTTSIIEWSKSIYNSDNGNYLRPKNQERESTLQRKELVSTEERFTYQESLFKDTSSNNLGLKKEEWALLIALEISKQLLGQSTQFVDIENNGRQQPHIKADLSRSVGWFTSMFSTSFPSTHSSNDLDYIKAIKEKYRNDKKRGPELSLVYNNWTLPLERMLFNYLGPSPDYAQDFKAEFIYSGVRSHFSERDYQLECNILDEGGNMIVVLTLPQTLKAKLDKERIIKRMNEYETTLLQGEKEYTPSDFEDVDLDQDDLDALLEQL